ncbi:MAG: rhodanese-like domain-containing protein [Acholeplasmataceae bacterium]
MIRKTILSILFVLFLTACQATGQSITPQDAQTMMIADPSIVLLDVRTQDEYNQGYIPGAILLPLVSLSSQIETRYPNKNQIFIIYCRSGIRSREAIEVMMNLGYKNLHDLGGIIDWPYDIQTS